jgi:ATP-dependent 26S proteasome regulatory subunit
MDGSGDPERQQALEQYKNKLLESREWESKLKALRMDIKGLQTEFETTEDNIKALQSVGQIIGEVLKQLDEERCMFVERYRNNSMLIASQSSSKHLQVLDTLLAAGRRLTRRN